MWSALFKVYINNNDNCGRILDGRKFLKEVARCKLDVLNKYFGKRQMYFLGIGTKSDWDIIGLETYWIVDLTLYLKHCSKRNMFYANAC